MYMTEDEGSEILDSHLMTRNDGYRFGAREFSCSGFSASPAIKAVRAAIGSF